jgi:hypothetical protein
MALVAAYNFDEASGALVLDRSGSGRDFSLTGSSVRTTGHTGSGLQQTVAEIQQGPVITGLNTVNRTVEFWAKAPGVDPSWIMEYHRGGADNTGVFGWLNLSGIFRLRAKNPSDVSFEITLTGDAANFHHYAATHDGTTLRAYVDGVQVGAGLSMAFPVWTADDLRFLDGAGSAAVLDDVRIYDNVLSAGQIVTDMNTPVGAAGGTVAIDGHTLTYHMNRKAGTIVNGVPTMSAQGAANIWAGTVGLELVHALNVRAGNTLPNFKELAGVLNQLAGTTGLEVDGAASSIP